MAKPADLYKVLQHSDLTKRGGARVGVLLLKIKNKEPFVTTQGDVILNESQHDYLRDAMPRSGFSAPLIGKVKGREVQVNYPKDFFKTADFGGRGLGSGTAAEDAELKLFRSHLESTIEKEGTSFIDVKVGGKIVQVAGIITTPNPGGLAPKADFDLIDHNGNSVGWISHKAGTKASDFQQYGGLSNPTFNVSEVTKFMRDVSKLAPEGLKSGQSYMRKVKDQTVIRKSVYGIQYGQKYGIENVSEFHLGHMKLTKSNGVYRIDSVHRGDNGDIPKGDFEAVYFIRYNDRTARAAGVTIQKSRVGVFARAKAAKTTVEI